MKEYPREYLGGNDIPYYPINNDKNNQIYQNYCNELSSISNFYLLGRLAEYKYYNMDAIIKEALILFDKWEGEI
jgi:UDP-galactopyranose mutase